MNVVKRVVEYLIAITVIPAIVLTVVHVTELKDVINVQYELLSEEGGLFNVTPGTYDRLVENKRIKNYELESNYPLITQEEMDRGTWQIGDVKNEIFIDENGVKRIRINVERIVLDGSETFYHYDSNTADTIAFHTGIFIGNSKLTMTDSTTAYSNLLPQQTVYFGFDREGFAVARGYLYIRINKSRLTGYNDSLSGSEKIKLFKQWLQDLANEGNPLTIWYLVAVKDPNSKVIESKDISITSDYVRLTKPNDFSNNPNGLLIQELSTSIDRYEVINNWIYVYPRGITVEELASRMVGKTLYYELAQPRPVEVYDFSKFRLTYDKNRIRVVFDIDDEYYLWEITKDDKMIPINGQYDLGNIWTVKFYVYEIQQPLIRNLVLLIPLIVVSGLLLYMMKKKDLSI